MERAKEIFGYRNEEKINNLTSLLKEANDINKSCWDYQAKILTFNSKSSAIKKAKLVYVNEIKNSHFLIIFDLF